MQSETRPFGNATAIPVNLDEAIAELSRVRIDMTLVQAQLAAKPKPLGIVSEEEFRDWREWRARAASAAQYKSARSQFLANWIKAHSSDSSEPKSTLTLVMVHMAVLLDELLGDDTDDFSPAAMQALRELRSWTKKMQVHPHSEISNGVAG